MKDLTVSNINKISDKELNNNYSFRFKCVNTTNEISVYKEYGVFNIKINHVNMIINSIEWLQMDKLSTVKNYLKQLV